jgi:hypothetical protein
MTKVANVICALHSVKQYLSKVFGGFVTMGLPKLVKSTSVNLAQIWDQPKNKLFWMRHKVVKEMEETVRRIEGLEKQAGKVAAKYERLVDKLAIIEGALLATETPENQADH